MFWRLYTIEIKYSFNKFQFDFLIIHKDYHEKFRLIKYNYLEVP